MVIVYIASLFIVCGLGLALWSIKPEPRVVRVGFDDDDVVPTSREMELQSSFAERVLKPLAEGGANRFGRYLPSGMLASIGKKLQAADMSRRYTPEMVLAAQAFLFAVSVTLATTYLNSAGGSRTNLMIAGLTVVVFTMAPNAIVSRAADDRIQAITNELPDVLDQLTVTVEAGMSFDGAVLRAAQEGRGVLTHEMLRAVKDMQLGLTRGEALQAMADRTDVPDLRTFVTAVRQAEKHGFPLANILRLQSLELRDRRRARAEERAMQVPVKITFPLVFCILPALFTVILGPAAVNISSGLGG